MSDSVFDVDVFDVDPSVYTTDVELVDEYDVNEFVYIEIVKSNITGDLYYIAHEPDLTYKYDKKVDWYDDVADEESLKRDFSILLPPLQKKVEQELKTGSLLDKSIEDRKQLIREKTREELESINTGHSVTDIMMNLVDKIDKSVDNEKITKSRVVNKLKKKSIDYSEKREEIPEEIFNKLIYYVTRNLAGYGKLQPVFDDEKIEDLSVNRPNSPCFVYHEDLGQHIGTNIAYDPGELSRLAKKIAQLCGKNISRAKPTVDGSLPDGSRVRLSYQTEVSPDGTSLTIRFPGGDPLTPIELINFGTYNYEQMAYMWLLIENKKSIIVAGGTASGKTTTLNALTMFMDRNYKIITIEDTQEVELPHVNYSKRLTREALIEGDESGTIDEFDLTVGALRERPDYILVGEVRGEEANSMFQAMNTGHATLSTLHANEPSSVIQRLQAGEIEVEKGLMEAIGSIVIQERLRGQGKVRVPDIQEIETLNYKGNLTGSQMYEYDALEDQYTKLYNNSASNLLRDIMRGEQWTEDELNQEIEDRKTVLKKMQEEEIDDYVDCYTVFQQYMNDKDKIMNMIENDMELIQVTDNNMLGDNNDG